jgi:hypothetical protein
LRTATINNLKRSYGEPTVKPWEKGLMEVSGKSPDFDSSYFLDREFWKATLIKHPEGVVVAVPKRGLLYVPLSDVDAVDEFKRGIAALYATSGQRRVSSALFLFRDSGWTVFQAPISHD